MQGTDCSGGGGTVAYFVTSVLSTTKKRTAKIKVNGIEKQSHSDPTYKDNLNIMIKCTRSLYSGQSGIRLNPSYTMYILYMFMNTSTHNTRDIALEPA